jgi:hypothetical protein
MSMRSSCRGRLRPPSLVRPRGTRALSRLRGTWRRTAPGERFAPLHRLRPRQGERGPFSGRAGNSNRRASALNSAASPTARLLRLSEWVEPDQSRASANVNPSMPCLWRCRRRRNQPRKTYCAASPAASHSSYHLRAQVRCAVATAETTTSHSIRSSSKNGSSSAPTPCLTLE